MEEAVVVLRWAGSIKKEPFWINEEAIFRHWLSNLLFIPHLQCQSTKATQLQTDTI